jgi:hypothetical protein
MVRRCALLLSLGLIVAACSGETSEPDSAPATNAPAATDAPTTTTTVADVAPLPGGSGWLQLENLAETGSDLDVALAEFAAVAGPVVGAAPIDSDGTVFPSITHALQTIEANRAELTDEQANAIDTIVAELFDPTEMIVEFALFDDAPEQTEGASPAGFASGLRSPDDSEFDEASDEIKRLITPIAADVRELLGGPRLNVWAQVFPRGTFGDAAGRNLGLEPGNLLRDEFPNDPDCLIQVTEGPLPADIVPIIAHELTHCWQFTRIGFDESRQIATADWAIEGMAAYVGEQVAPTRFNAEWWGGYLTTRIDRNGQWDMYRRSYDALGFWSRVAAGDDIAAAMRRTVDASPNDAAMFRAATSGLGAGVAWVGAGTFERPDWGPGWTGSGPGSPGTPRTVTAHTVIERNDVALSSDTGAQSNHEISISPVSGADGSVVTARGSGTGVLRVDPDDVVLSGSFVEDWCIGICECPDGTPAFPDDRIRSGPIEMAASLVGGANEASTLNVRVGAFDPDDAGDTARCEEDEDEAEEPSPDTDADSLLGTWRANADAVASMYEQASSFGGQPGFDVLGANGDVLLTFAEGGAGRLVYDDVTILIADQAVGDVNIGGAGDFAWTIDGGALVITDTTFEFSVSTSALGGIPLKITDADVPNVGSTSLSGGVSGEFLTISSADGAAGRVFFPNTWVRVDE